MSDNTKQTITIWVGLTAIAAMFFGLLAYGMAENFNTSRSQMEVCVKQGMQWVAGNCIGNDGGRT